MLTIFASRPASDAGPAESLRRLAQDHGSAVKLPGLRPSDVTAMAQGFGHRLSAAAAGRLCAHTGGNPLHLDALFRELTTAQLHASDSLPAPRAFSLLVTSVVAGLAGDAQDLARAAAVLGDSVPVSLAAHLAGVAAPHQAVDRVASSGLLKAVHTPKGWALRWSHPLIRAAVYEDLGLTERARLHQKAAEASDGIMSLMHRVSASLGPDEELASELEAAATGALEAGRMRSSAELSIQAYGISAVPQRAAARLIAGIDRMLACGDVTAVQSLCPDVGELPDTAQALHTRARLAWLSGDHAAAVTLGESSWALTGPRDSALRSALAEMLTFLKLASSDLEDAVLWADKALSAPATSRQRSVVQAGAVVSLAYQGHTRNALARVADLGDDPLTVTRERHPELRARGFARLVGDDWAGSTRDLLAVAAAVGTDPAPERLLALGGAAEGEYRLGHWDASLRHAEQAVSLGEDSEQLWILGVLHCAPVLVLAPRGQWVQAERHLRRAEEVTRLAGDDVATRAYLLDAQVHLDVCRGDFSAVVERAASTVLGVVAVPREPGVLRLPVHYASALVSLGRFEEAQEALVVFEAKARETGRASRICALARVRGELATALRDTTQARAAFDEAKELEPSADALETGLIHLAAGRFHRRRGERRAAGQELSKANDLFDALGAKPWADRCANELALTGIGPKERGRADDVASWAQLTPQEQLVADLVCRGLTNQEVATDLVLSPKTVSYHLTNVYTKLGVHSRTQLAAHSMARRTPPPGATA